MATGRWSMAVQRRQTATWLVASACVLVASASAAGGIQESERGRTEAPQRTIAGTIVVGQVDRRTIQSALEVLPRRPARIVIIDDAAAPSGAHRARDLMASCRLEAASSTCVGRARRCAARSSRAEPISLCSPPSSGTRWRMPRGLTRLGARQQEEDLWESFVRAGRVDSAVGLSYLAALKRRR